MKQVWIWITTGRKKLMKTVTGHCALLWVLSMEVENTGAYSASTLYKNLSPPRGPNFSKIRG